MKQCASFLLLLAALIPAGCLLPPFATYNYGPWGTPENLGSVVNTTANDQHPAISPDGLSLYFHSNRTGNIPGSNAGTTDIWVTHRETLTSAFGPAVNLGRPSIPSAMTPHPTSPPTATISSSARIATAAVAPATFGSHTGPILG